MTFEEITELAQKVLDGKSNSYVQDAHILAKVLLRDYKPTLDNLSSTQTRCTELLEENRRFRIICADYAKRSLEAGTRGYDKVVVDDVFSDAPHRRSHPNNDR